LPKNLILQRKGKNRYSRVKLNEKGDCPFIDENKLCMVHRDLGEEALAYLQHLPPEFNSLQG
jgi:lysine-N-methylase